MKSENRILFNHEDNNDDWDSGSWIPVSPFKSVESKYSFQCFLCKMAGDEGGSRVLDVLL